MSNFKEISEIEKIKLRNALANVPDPAVSKKLAKIERKRKYNEFLDKINYNDIYK